MDRVGSVIDYISNPKCFKPRYICLISPINFVRNWSHWVYHFRFATSELLKIRINKGILPISTIPRIPNFFFVSFGIHFVPFGIQFPNNDTCINKIHFHAFSSYNHTFHHFYPTSLSKVFITTFNKLNYLFHIVKLFFI